jgi:hypothetical protein
MDPSGDATEQIARISFMGVEYGLRIVGGAGERIVKLIASVLAQGGQSQTAGKPSGKTKGKTRLANMLKSNRPISIFEIRQSNLKQFATQAKRYGVKYAVIRDPDAGGASPVDIMVFRDDAPKINRIIEKFGFAAVDTEVLLESVELERADELEVPKPQPGKDSTLSEQIAADFISGSAKDDEGKIANPTQALVGKPLPSEPTSRPPETSAKDTLSELDAMFAAQHIQSSRPSVKEAIKDEEKRRAELPPKPKAPPQRTAHQQPTPRPKPIKLTKPKER